MKPLAKANRGKGGLPLILWQDGKAFEKPARTTVAANTRNKA